MRFLGLRIFTKNAQAARSATSDKNHFGAWLYQLIAKTHRITAIHTFYAENSVVGGRTTAQCSGGHHE